jgi:hypothetical protein
MSAGSTTAAPVLDPARHADTTTLTWGGTASWLRTSVHSRGLCEALGLPLMSRRTLSLIGLDG